jgi:hypothetical protein
VAFPELPLALAAALAWAYSTPSVRQRRFTNEPAEHGKNTPDIVARVARGVMMNECPITTVNQSRLYCLPR